MNLFDTKSLHVASFTAGIVFPWDLESKIAQLASYTLSAKAAVEVAGPPSHSNALQEAIVKIALKLRRLSTIE
jgi:hypothetical protein